MLVSAQTAIFTTKVDQLATKKILLITLVVALSIACSDDDSSDDPSNGLTPPVADFSASETAIATGATVNFTDSSTNEPTSWAWEFEGGNPVTSNEQNPSITYDSSGTFEVTLTATNSSGSDTETKIGYIIVDQQTASYSVTFKGNWSATNHPIDFPSGSDHFSPVVGMVHKSGTTIFELGELATSGIEDMAELGSTSNLNNEIDALVDSGTALNRINGGGLGGGTTETTFTIELTEEFSLVTLVSMIAPSPDWFVATENVNLFDNGEFVDNISVDAISYDSGTDSGATFTSGNDDTDPAENIFLITDAPLGNGTTVDPPVAFFIFEKN